MRVVRRGVDWGREGVRLGAETRGARLGVAVLGVREGVSVPRRWACAATQVMITIRAVIIRLLARFLITVPFVEVLGRSPESEARLNVCFYTNPVP